ncbi:hypothetical protein KP509_1Z320900 [Ceratopteris richardii]|nr:hypothetical protein KP509_1Z320900 [Ceratopteris richardii]
MSGREEGEHKGYSGMLNSSVIKKRGEEFGGPSESLRSDVVKDTNQQMAKTLGNRQIYADMKIEKNGNEEGDADKCSSNTGSSRMLIVLPCKNLAKQRLLTIFST